MFQLRKYKLEMDIKGIILFLVIMLPNIIWFLIPASMDDPLRKESITPFVDIVAQVFQVLMVAALAVIKNQDGSKNLKGKAGLTIFMCLALYYVGWILYYVGVVNAIIHLDLCIAPCAAFIIFSYWRKNAVALISAIGFAICHIIFACINFIL